MSANPCPLLRLFYFQERVSLYDSKVGHFIDDLKGMGCFTDLTLFLNTPCKPSSFLTSAGPKQRTTVLNVEAANRVIEHAIPDLTEGTKNCLGRLHFTNVYIYLHKARGTYMTSNKYRKIECIFPQP